MTTKINNSRIEWIGYQFGVRTQWGTTITRDRREAEAIAKEEHAEIVFRTLYGDEWEPVR